MSSHDGQELEPVGARTPDADPVPDPGHPPHKWRPTDVDERLEKRAERQVATFFALSGLCSVLFVVSYFVFDIGEVVTTVGGFGASHLALGLTLGGALLFGGMGAIHWSRKLMSDVALVEARHPIASSPEDREVTVSGFNTGLEETGIARRPLVRNTLLGALGVLALPVPIVLLRDLGPLPGDKLKSTIWDEGMRVVRDVTGTPIRASDMQFGDLINAEPAALFEVDENGEPLIEGAELQREKAKGAVILVRIEPEEITPGEGRDDWGVEGILCYSKICTHVGCPISLYERTTHHVLCPCHQSTFDLADAARVVFGPAARPLPQLPLDVDSEGYLVARSDFDEPVGPSFWERDSR
ncbi:ubiquinol-cytochrome c reductase iron-sulfur subunit [Nocardioides sp.]|uniref:cytochrome bc1 complex Rieske iron-sulfur subunit n=1 Tax=Nocardioides sp. TaxID=35761 RepID=UPI002ED4A829